MQHCIILMQNALIRFAGDGGNEWRAAAFGRVGAFSLPGGVLGVGFWGVEQKAALSVTPGIEETTVSISNHIHTLPKSRNEPGERW